MKSLDAFAQEKLDQLSERSLKRTLATSRPVGGVRIERDGRPLVSFCSNDYLGLATDPRLRAAATEAVAEYGAGAGAARLITGNHPLFEALEARLARLKGTEDAVVFGSGYLANLGVIPALIGRDDLIVADALCHASANTGARLSGARVALFSHNDLDACRAVLEADRGKHGRCLIMTEGTFGMDGDLAPLQALAALAEAHDAWLLVDDAHGFGVLGEGHGTARAEGVSPGSIPLQIGTLSKAVGAYGGFLAASEPVCALMRNRARSFVYSTALPPSVVASAIAGLYIIAEEPDWVARPLRLAARFAEASGLPAPSSQIVPVLIGDSAAALAASEALTARGFLVTAIRPPTVPEDTARLRVTFSAAHEDSDVAALAAAMIDLGLVPGRESPDMKKAAQGGLSKTPVGEEG